jgi:hypothetical protein
VESLAMDAASGQESEEGFTYSILEYLNQRFSKILQKYGCDDNNGSDMDTVHDSDDNMGDEEDPEDRCQDNDGPQTPTMIEKSVGYITENKDCAKVLLLEILMGNRIDIKRYGLQLLGARFRGMEPLVLITVDDCQLYEIWVPFSISFHLC